MDRALVGLGGVKIGGYSPVMVARNKINRLLFAKVFRRRATSVIETVDHFKIKVPIDDQAACSILFEKRYYPLQCSVVKKLLSLAVGFIDVGANLGYYSLLAAAVYGKQCPVLAVEPNADLSALIRESAALNGFTRVRVETGAVGRSAGVGRFFVDPSSSAIGTATLDDSDEARSRPGRVVQFVSLDSLLEGMEPVQRLLIKIDVEGHEAEVLAGGRRALELQSLMLCEVSSRSFPVISELLREFDYEVVDLQGNKWSGRDAPRHRISDVVLAPARDVGLIQQTLRAA